jgi:hypothetical protein
MKGDIITLWEQHLTQQFSSLIISITLNSSGNQDAEWRFCEIEVEKYLVTHPLSLIKTEVTSSMFIYFNCFYNGTDTCVPYRILQRWVDSNFPPLNPRKFSLPERVGGVALVWSLFLHRFTGNLTLYSSFNCFSIERDRIYPPLDNIPFPEYTDTIRKKGAVSK